MPGNGRCELCQAMGGAGCARQWEGHQAFAKCVRSRGEKEHLLRRTHNSNLLAKLVKERECVIFAPSFSVYLFEATASNGFGWGENWLYHSKGRHRSGGSEVQTHRRRALRSRCKISSRGCFRTRHTTSSRPDCRSPGQQTDTCGLHVGTNTPGISRNVELIISGCRDLLLCVIIGIGIGIRERFNTVNAVGSHAVTIGISFLDNSWPLASTIVPSCLV